ncbi:hypothetical protein BX600DRAFT_228960 [Xylariales sp. PMI_506]|nr:hypothetical protein BX600DRAFT_228960 [Xylariales sp. PMI_506]
MAPIKLITSAALMLLGTVQAHFELLAPSSIGFDDDNEGNGPCGGFTADFSKDNVTSFSAGGDYIFTLSAHPQMNYLYRITSDATGSGNWTQIFPIIQQTGLGDLCEPAVSVDSTWVGTTALLSVVGNGPDGILYQCAVVNFVSGVNSNIPSTCVNGSAVSATLGTDATLTSLLSSSSSSNTSSTTTSSTAAATSSKNASPATFGSLEGAWSILTVAGMMAVGAAFVL